MRQMRCDKTGNSSRGITMSSLFVNCNHFGCWCRNPEMLAKLVAKNEVPAAEAY